MEYIKNAKWFLTLSDANKLTILFMGVSVGLFLALQYQSARLDSANGKIEVLNQSYGKLQQEKEQQAVNFKEEKYNAVIKEKEDCEISKQNIHKSYADAAKKITKKH